MISLGQLRVIWIAMIGGTAPYTLVIFALVSLGAISVDARQADRRRAGIEASDR